MASVAPALFPSSQTFTDPYAGLYPGPSSWPGAMAFLGPVQSPSTATFPNTNVYPGQGNLPIVRARVTFDDVSIGTPVWTDLSDRLRSYSINRGRNSELDQFDAGTASAVFQDNDRSLDPNSNANVRPLNRIWLYEEFSGETHDLFRGYAERWEANWDQSGIFDATATVNAADEFKVLSLGALPVTNPPRDSYADVVAFDVPISYLRANDQDGTGTFEPTIGDTKMVQDGAISIVGHPDAGGALIGDTDGYISIGSSDAVYVDQPPFQGQGGDAAALAAFTIEAWVSVSSLSLASFPLQGPLTASSVNQWFIKINTTGSIDFQVKTTVSTYTASSSAGAMPVGSFAHIVGVFGSNAATLYVNGSQVATVATSGTITTGYSTLVTPARGNGMVFDSSVATMGMDEIAFYRYALSASRISAHYDAGHNRGFSTQMAGPRISTALDVIGPNHAPRSLQTGVRTIATRYMKGQAPIETIAEAVAAEAVDAAFFTKADGSLTFLASDHRSASPYNTSQATYGDAGGSELAYLDCKLDYSESFLFNEWNVTRDGGVTQTTSDSTSISRYFKRTQSLTGLALNSDSDAATVASAMLAKYKDPMQRVVSISPNMGDAETARVTYQRELMDRITVKRRPPGGGSPISQDLFIQSIEHSGTPGVPPTCTLGVSPL